MNQHNRNLLAELGAGVNELTDSTTDLTKVTSGFEDDAPDTVAPEAPQDKTPITDLGEDE